MSREPKVRIEELVAEATAKLQKAVELADQYGIDFEFRGPVDTYEEDLGFGGTYNAGNIWEASGSCEWEESGENESGSFDHGVFKE